MNPLLSRLSPYPFERLRALLAGVTPPGCTAIRLSIGEPQHATPGLIREALDAHLDGLSVYPTTSGLDELRSAVAGWCARRAGVALRLDPQSQVLPVTGTREALFAFAQAVVDPSRPRPLVVCPNPFYQIYEGAALLAGAEVVFLNQVEDQGFAFDLSSIDEAQWGQTQLLYVCTPGNPTGRVLTLDDWRELFALSDRHGFVIASDECYSDIYDRVPPLGGLEAAQRLGRTGFQNLVVFVSLSKRSNAPGLRSGAVAGDASILKAFLLYRTYHGSAMSLTTQHASIAAWTDDQHVEDNRARYRAKFDAVVPILAPVMQALRPDAGFYLWARVPGHDDEAFARNLFASTHVTVLPGQYLARDAHGINPGRGYVRIALVPDLSDCTDAAHRIAAFCR
ncbi:MAG TPA: succinyldiaminopimelate transaminase [Vicinamibacterales bacterium]|nr:succinyldiaminopimelate transaminase [Vicinamibacterales bacterium]